MCHVIIFLSNQNRRDVHVTQQLDKNSKIYQYINSIHGNDYTNLLADISHIILSILIGTKINSIEKNYFTSSKFKHHVLQAVVDSGVIHRGR